MLTRVSQMHEALSSIVDACQSSSSSSPDDSRSSERRQLQQQLLLPHQQEGGGRGGEEGGGDVGEQLSSVVTSEEGAVIVERSRSCLRVSLWCQKSDRQLQEYGGANEPSMDDQSPLFMRVSFSTK